MSITRSAILGSFVALATLLAGGAMAASYDCNRRLPPDLRLICDDPRLSARDDRAAMLYDRLFATTDPAGREGLKAQRRNFQRERGACRNDRRCLANVYDGEINTLRGMFRGPPPPMAPTGSDH